MKKHTLKVITVSLILIDQITKYLAETKLTFYAEKHIMPGLSLTKVHNYGAAYGILQNQQTFLIGLSFTILLLGWINRHKLAHTPLGYLGLSIIASGAIGNLTDRIIRGYVVDFLDIQIIPVFNLADLLINIGILCLIIDTWQTSTHH